VTCLALFTPSESRWHDALVSAVHGHDLPLQILRSDPGGEIPQAVSGLAPLSLAGALVEGRDAQIASYDAAPRREVEAEEAGRVDALKVQFGAVTGNYLWPEAMRTAIEHAGFSGARVLWLGDAAPGLRDALRTVRTVHVWQSSPTAGEAILQLLPAPQRGRVLLNQAQVEAMMVEVDLVVYAGGGLPLGILQPYHGLFALREPPLQDAYLAVEQVISPGYFLQVYLSRLLTWVAEIDLPPDAFALHGGHGS